MAAKDPCNEHFPSLALRSSSEERKEQIQGQFRTARGGRTSPTHSAHGCLIRTSLQKFCQEKKAKRIRIYRNGDKFFKGFVYALSSERIRSLSALLEDLTRVLVDQVNLPKGVRHIFSLDGKEKVTELDQLQDGDSYVCSSVDRYISTDYAKVDKPLWNAICKTEDGAKPDCPCPAEPGAKEVRNFIRPKLLTVIRNGIKPRKAVRILLNKKTAHSFDQVLGDITCAIKLDTGAVRKVFTLSGRQVTSLADFFGDEDIFIAYGPEKYSHDDFDLDSEECKYLSGGARTPVASRKSRGINATFTPSSRQYASLNGSPCSSGRSSLAASPKSIRKFGPKSTSSRSKVQNGYSASCGASQPKEITDQYEVGKVVGDGNFAVVRECKDRTTKQEYALKIIDKTKCKGKEHMIASEVAILRQVKHPNIVQLLAEYDFENELYLVMELVKGGDLFDAIASATKYTERDASGMVYNLASALKYLHALNIVHRDIKPENLLVVNHNDGSKSLKLGDFGLAVEANEPLFTVCGTPTYVAPEILAEIGYGLKVDIWASGVITYILLCGFPPFVSQGKSQDELFEQILIGKYEFLSPYWDDISESAKDLISSMLQTDPNLRHSAAEVLEHSWVAGDTAKETDVLFAVSEKLSIHFDHKPKSSLKSAGIALLARTPLDREMNRFHDRHCTVSQESLQSFHPRQEENLFF